MPISKNKKASHRKSTTALHQQDDKANSDIDYPEGAGATSQLLTLPTTTKAIDSSGLSYEDLEKRIESAESISGSIKDLLFTHNTNASGLLGILASNRMIATVERNVNFRYGIDSRYAGGVTFIMKDEFYKKYKDYYIQDLYNQRQYLMGDKKAMPSNASESDIAELLSFVSNISDFRHIQMAALTGHLKPIAAMGKNKSSILSKRYKLSVVNPQIRIPWNINKITMDDIDKIIVADRVDDEIMSAGYAEKVSSGFTKFSAYLKGIGGDEKDKLVREEVTQALKKQNGQNAIHKYNQLRESGFIKIVSTNGEEIFSHQAGRMASRSLKDDKQLRKAAMMGLDIHSDFFEEAMNNSPSALSLHALTQFEKAYFSHLLMRLKFK